MNKAIANLLNKLLGVWIENLNSEQLNLSIFSGKICLTDLKLKSDFLDILGVPFSLLSGTVQRIEVKIPWSSLYSHPLEVTISEVNLLLHPIPLNQWNEDKEKLSLLKTRNYYLEHFELMNPDDFEMSNTNGSGGIFASKLLDNLQLKIENVYVRYEDRFYSYENFTVGCFIKSATLNNCDKQWEKNLSSGDFVYKLLQFEEISFFVDYGEGIVICQEWYDGTVEECLWQMSRDEILGKISHKYLVSPSCVTIKIVINKEEIQNFPLFAINLFLVDLKIKMYISQIEYLLSIKTLINEHFLFKKSIENGIPARSFRPAEIERHRKAYLEYRLCMKDELSTQELKDFLMSNLLTLELGIYLDEIKLQRKSVINDQKLTKMQMAKKEEINKMNKQSSLKTLWRYFSTKSKNEIEEEQQNLAERLKSAEMDLARLEYRSCSVVRKITRANTGKLEFMTDKVEYNIILTVEYMNVEVLNEENKIFVAEYKGLKAEVMLRLASKKFFIKSKDFVLWNKNPESIFGVLMKIGKFEFEFDTQDLKMIKWKSEKLEFFIDIDSIFTIFLIIKKLFEENSESNESFSSGSSLKTEEEVWRLYTALGEFLEYGVVNSYYIEIMCKNLKVWVPTDSKDANLPILVSEIKEIKTITEKQKIHGLAFEVYKTEFTDFSMYIKYESIEEVVLGSVSFTLFINICKTIQFLRSGYRFEVKFSPISLYLTEKNLLIFVKIQKLFFKFSESSDVEKSKLDKSEMDSEQQEGLQSFVMKLGKIIKTKVFISFTKISLKFWNGLFVCENIQGKLKFNNVKSIFFVCTLQKCNFYESGLEFLKAKLCADNKFAVKVVASYLPSESLVFLSIKISELKLKVTSNIIKALMNYYSICLSSYKKNRKSSHFVQSDPKSQNSKFSLQIENAKIQLSSSNPQNWNALKIDSSIHITLNTFDIAEYRYTPVSKKISEVFVNSSNENMILLSNIQVTLKNPFQKKILAQRFRVYLENNQEFSLTSSGKINNFCSIPQLSLNIGFRDINFFSSIYSEFSPFLSVQSSNYNISSTNILELASCQLILTDDTISDPVPILNPKLKQVLITQTQELILVTGEITSRYFDKVFKTWQIFQDSWKFIMKNSLIEENNSEWQLSGDSLLELYFTPNLCEVLGTLHSKLYENSENWGDMYKLPEVIKENFDYQIINNLGVQAQFWAQIAPDTIYNLSPLAPCSIKYSEMQSLYSKTSKKNIQLFENLHKICLEIIGLGVIPNICLQNSKPEVFTLKSVSVHKEIEKSHNHIQVTFSGIHNILNQTEINLIVGHENDDYLVQEFFTLPIYWDLEKVYIESSDTRIPLSGNELIQIGPGRFIGCDRLDFEYNEKIYKNGFLVRPPYVFQNLIPFDICVCVEKFEDVKVLTGNTANCFYVGISSMLVKIKILIGDKIVVTEAFRPGYLTQEVRVLCGFESFLVVSMKDLSRSCIEIGISCEICLVNYTNYSVLMNDIVIPDNFPGFFLVNNKTTIELCVYKEECAYKSAKLDFNTINLSESLICKPEKNCELSIILGLLMSSMSMDTKIFKVFPRFILKNDLSLVIYVRQYSSKTDFPASKIGPNENFHLYLTGSKNKQAIQISENLSDWSSGFTIDQIDDFQVKFKSETKHHKSQQYDLDQNTYWHLPCRENSYCFYARVTVFTENQACINIAIRVPAMPDYKVVNSTDFDIKIKQKGSKAPYFLIPPGASIPWVYENYLSPSKKLLIEYQGFTQAFNFNKFKEKYKKIGQIPISLYTSGNTRVLELLMPTSKRSNKSSDLINSFSKTSEKRFILTCTQVSFTLCDSNLVEKALATCTNFQLKYSLESTNLFNNTSISSQFNLSIGNFQLDNMDIGNGMFPVIVTRAYHDNLTPIFQVIYNRVYSNTKQTEKFTKDVFPALELQFQPIILNINYEVMEALYLLQQEYILKYYLNPTRALDSCTGIIFPYIFPDPPEDSLKSYFEFIRIHSFDLKVTFRKEKNSKIFKNFPLLFRVFTNKFLDCARITNSPLKLKEIIIQHSFHSRYTVFWSLIANYTRQCLMQFYRVLGATQILGNPIGLIEKLGTGVFEFLAEPANGMLKSYKEFLWGASKGTRSLVGNLVEGGFESISGITGSLHYMISEEYSGKNELLCKLGIYDLKNGIRSITYKPYKGLKDRGLKGFVQELSIGLCSASISPISALLHLSHTITSQIANEGRKLKDSNPYQQLRPPLILTPFNELLKCGNLKEIMQKSDINLTQIKFFTELKNESIILTEDLLIIIKQLKISDQILRNKIGLSEVYCNENHYFLLFQTESKIFRIVSCNRSALIKLYFLL